MKIIIDIPRAKYNTLRNDSTDYRGNIGVIYRAVQNGIVLPENHGDLSSVNPQKPKTDTWSIKDVADTLAKHGLIVEQEPKPGHWIRMKAYEKWGCSECNTVFRFTFKEHDYCPNCGARMVELQESEE